jgi:hypothetical protein
MLKDRIIKTLKRRPYWGPQSVAKALGTTPQVVRVVASRENIKFMDRYEVETYVDALVETIEKMEEPPRGEA